MSEKMQEGLVIKSQSGFFEVEITDSSLITCELRGRLKQGARKGDLIAVGDRVRFSPLAEGTGMIEEILPRERAIVRMDPRPRGLYRQVLLANPDQAVFVFACAKPDPHLRMLDRFLVIAEQHNIPVLIVANKVDLVGARKPKRFLGIMPKLAIPLFTHLQRKRSA